MNSYGQDDYDDEYHRRNQKNNLYQKDDRRAHNPKHGSGFEYDERQFRRQQIEKYMQDDDTPYDDSKFVEYLQKIHTAIQDQSMLSTLKTCKQISKEESNQLNEILQSSLDFLPATISLFASAESIIQASEEKNYFPNNSSTLSNLKEDIEKMRQVQKLFTSFELNDPMELLALSIVKLEQVPDKSKEFTQAILSVESEISIDLPFKQIQDVFYVKKDYLKYEFMKNLTSKVYSEGCKDSASARDKAAKLQEKIKQMFNKAFQEIENHIEDIEKQHIERISQSLKNLKAISLSPLVKQPTSTFNLSAAMILSNIQHAASLLSNEMLAYQIATENTLDQLYAQIYQRNQSSVKTQQQFELINPQELKALIENELLREIYYQIEEQQESKIDLYQSFQSGFQEEIDIYQSKLVNVVKKPQITKVKPNYANQDLRQELIELICEKDWSWTAFFKKNEHGKDLIQMLLEVKEQTFLDLFNEDFYQNILQFEIVQRSQLKVEYNGENICLYMIIGNGKQIELHTYLSQPVIKFILGKSEEIKKEYGIKQLVKISGKRMEALLIVVMVILYSGLDLGSELRYYFSINLFKEMCFACSEHFNQSFESKHGERKLAFKGISDQKQISQDILFNVKNLLKGTQIKIKWNGTSQKIISFSLNFNYQVMEVLYFQKYRNIKEDRNYYDIQNELIVEMDEQGQVSSGYQNLNKQEGKLIMKNPIDAIYFSEVFTDKKDQEDREDIYKMIGMYILFKQENEILINPYSGFFFEDLIPFVISLSQFVVSKDTYVLEEQRKKEELRKIKEKEEEDRLERERIRKEEEEERLKKIREVEDRRERERIHKEQEEEDRREKEKNRQNEEFEENKRKEQIKKEQYILQKQKEEQELERLRLKIEKEELEKEKQNVQAEKQNVQAEKQNVQAEKQNVQAEKQELEKEKQIIKQEKEYVQAEKESIDENKRSLEIKNQKIIDLQKLIVNENKDIEIKQKDYDILYANIQQRSQLIPNYASENLQKQKENFEQYSHFNQEAINLEMMKEKVRKYIKEVTQLEDSQPKQEQQNRVQTKYGSQNQFAIAQELEKQQDSKEYDFIDENTIQNQLNQDKYKNKNESPSKIKSTDSSQGGQQQSTEYNLNSQKQEQTKHETSKFDNQHNKLMGPLSNDTSVQMRLIQNEDYNKIPQQILRNHDLHQLSEEKINPENYNSHKPAEAINKDHNQPLNKEQQISQDSRMIEQKTQNLLDQNKIQSQISTLRNTDQNQHITQIIPQQANQIQVNTPTKSLTNYQHSQIKDVDVKNPSKSNMSKQGSTIKQLNANQKQQHIELNKQHRFSLEERNEINKAYSPYKNSSLKKLSPEIVQEITEKWNDNDEKYFKDLLELKFEIFFEPRFSSKISQENIQKFYLNQNSIIIFTSHQLSDVVAIINKSIGNGYSSKPFFQFVKINSQNHLEADDQNRIDNFINRFQFPKEYYYQINYDTTTFNETIFNDWCLNLNIPSFKYLAIIKFQQTFKSLQEISIWFSNRFIQFYFIQREKFKKTLVLRHFNQISYTSFMDQLDGSKSYYYVSPYGSYLFIPYCQQPILVSFSQQAKIEGLFKFNKSQLQNQGIKLLPNLENCTEIELGLYQAIFKREIDYILSCKPDKIYNYLVNLFENPFRFLPDEPDFFL